MNYKQLDRKASQLVTKVQNKIDRSGAYENAGQKELRTFCDMVDSSDLYIQEKFQLKDMMIQAIDNLKY